MPRNHRTAISRCRTAGIALAAGTLAVTSLTTAADAAEPTAPTTTTGNVVVEWNQTLLSLVQTPVPNRRQSTRPAISRS
jgi:hypothetical protein